MINRMTNQYFCAQQSFRSAAWLQPKQGLGSDGRGQTADGRNSFPSGQSGIKTQP